MNRHMKTHCDNFLNCDRCERSFNRRDNLKRHVRLLHRNGDDDDAEASSNAGGVLTMKSLALPKHFEDDNGDVMLLFICPVDRPKKKVSSVRLFLHELSEDDGLTRPFMVLVFDREEFVNDVLNKGCVLSGDLLRARTETVLLAIDMKQCVTRTRDYLGSVYDRVDHRPQKMFPMVFYFFSAILGRRLRSHLRRVRRVLHVRTSDGDD
jgi:hypothetical protein